MLHSKAPQTIGHQVDTGVLKKSPGLQTNSCVLHYITWNSHIFDKLLPNGTNHLVLISVVKI